MGFLDRIKFKFIKQPFLYNELVGRGYSVRGYSIWRDSVLVQTSQFGYVSGRDWIARAEYLEIAKQVAAANQKVADKRAEYEKANS